MPSCSTDTHDDAPDREAAATKAQEIFGELFAHMGRAMRQYCHAHHLMAEDTVDPHTMYVAMQGFFERMAARHAQASTLALTSAQLGVCLRFTVDQLDAAGKAGAGRAGLLQSSTAAEFASRAPVVTLEKIYRHLRQEPAQRGRGVPSHPLAGRGQMDTVVFVARRLDQRLGIAAAPAGAVGVVHWCAAVVALVPVRRLRDLIVLVAEQLALMPDASGSARGSGYVEWFLAASIYHAWSLLDARHATALCHLSTIVCEGQKSSGGGDRTVLAWVQRVLDEEESLQSLSTCVADPLCAAEAFTATAASETQPSGVGEVGAHVEGQGEALHVSREGEDNHSDSSASSSVADASEGIDTDFWLRLSS